MSDSEWKDANPVTADLPNKGRTVILLLVGGLILGAMAFVGARIRPLGLAVGGFAFFTGIGMLMRMRTQKQKTNFKPTLVLTTAGFLLLLSNPRFGLAAGFAVYFLIVGALGLVAAGLFKAIKLAWDLGRRS